MSFLKKLNWFVFAALLFISVMVCSTLIYANDYYPLENGEKLVEERIVDKDHVDIFTQLDKEYFLKKLTKEEDKWTVVSSDIITQKRTGLKIDTITEKGDRQLASSIQAELRSFGIESASMPAVLDYSQSDCLPPVGDQMDISSCVGWSAGYYLRTYQQAKDIGWAVKEAGNGLSSHIFSPSFIYNQINKGLDEGADIYDAAELLKNIGAATLERFPNISGDYKTQPSQDVLQSANTNRVREWAKLYTKNDPSEYIILKTREYLNTGDLVVAGGNVGFKFYYPIEQGGKSIITTDTSIFGKHAYVIVGYDDNLVTPDGTGAFKLINSWGTEWGIQGFGYISYKAFTTNALEGYVFTDLPNCTSQELSTEVNNSVVFNLDFSGTGRFDIKIKDENNELVYEKKDLRGNEGLNSFIWDGRNNSGNLVEDKLYKLNVIPYINDTPKTPFELAFNKEGKVESAGSCAYIYESSIQYVSIPITIKADGMLNIKVTYDGAAYDIIAGQAVKAGESMQYSITKSEFDFNNKEPDKLKILIEVK